MMSANTLVCGLIANPIGHSLSPLLHNTLAERMGVDLAYLPFPVREAEQLGEAIHGAHALGMQGLNVTVPYKTAVLPFLCGLDRAAEQIGAVNTLLRTEQGYLGCNTDLPGMERLLKREGISLRGEPVLLLGAGGAARAVAVMAALHGASELTVLNRSAERAAQLVSELQPRFPNTCFTVAGLDGWRELSRQDYIAFQCSSVGMYPDAEKSLIPETDFYHKLRCGVDLIYTPSETEFMRRLSAAGREALGGLDMLLYQGVLSFELWTGRSVPEALCAELRACLQRELSRRERE